MANLMKVVSTTEMPEGVSQLNCVKRFGGTPKKIGENNLLGFIGNYEIYTSNVREVYNFLLSKGIDKKELFWQDLDAYGPNDVFKFRD